MCGIAGWIDERDAAQAPYVLQRMNDAIAHRGPDGQGEYFAKTRDDRHAIALGHRRLAIIDLVTGDQPMCSPDGATALVFNGEIYNFKELRDDLRRQGQEFATTSDTEVLLNAYRVWGPECVRRLRGMYAFAIWDAAREQLVLGRDRFGKKPLYLWQHHDTLIFASEIKALLVHPKVKAELDLNSVSDYLQYRYVPGPHTLFKGIAKLRPGAYGVWKDGKLIVRDYYLPPDGGERPVQVAAAEDAVGAFADRLDECIRLRMVSDVPFGAFLSGGVDSSAVVALMTRHSNMPINTFSVGFRESQYSELRYARLVAERFKTNHHEIVVAAEHVMALLPRLIAYRDAPLAETADVPIYLLSCEAAKSVKMVLTGEGSDELLAGYPKHLFEPYVAVYQALMPQGLHHGLIEPLVGLLPSRYYRISTLIKSFGLTDPRERLPRWFGAISLAERDRLSAIEAPPRPADARPFAVAEDQTPLRRMLYFDQTSWLPDNLLERGDRMTMAASIEARMPFMDHELAALVTRYPDGCRIRRGEQKWLLRRAMRDILPAEILNRPKVGFRLPVNEWFRTTLKDFVYDHLLGQDSRTRHYWRPGMLKTMLDQHSARRSNHEKLIWALLTLELFQRHYRLT